MPPHEHFEGGGIAGRREFLEQFGVGERAAALAAEKPADGIEQRVRRVPCHGRGFRIRSSSNIETGCGRGLPDISRLFRQQGRVISFREMDGAKSSIRNTYSVAPMRFMLAFRFCFQRSGWFVNLLLLAVCLLIPYVGPIVRLGYCAEVAVALEHDPDLRKYPLFRFWTNACYDIERFSTRLYPSRAVYSVAMGAGGNGPRLRIDPLHLPCILHAATFDTFQGKWRWSRCQVKSMHSCPYRASRPSPPAQETLVAAWGIIPAREASHFSLERSAGLDRGARPSATVPPGSRSSPARSPAPSAESHS